MAAKRKRKIRAAPEAADAYERVRRAKVGRPATTVTKQSRERVMRLRADGWEAESIARVLGISEPTLQKHYGYELEFGAEIKRDRYMELLNKKAEKLHAPSIKYLLERAEGALSSRAARRQEARASEASATIEPLNAKSVKIVKLGKKEQAQERAMRPDGSNEMGQLMLKRSKELMN